MIFLHIGLKKTGSTTLQRFASGNLELLAAAGIDYPPIGFAAFAHHRIDAALREPGAGTAEAEARLAELSDYLRANAGRRILLSCENFSALDEKGVARLVAIAREHHDVRVLLYVRDLVGWVPSIYNQRSKTALSVLDFDTSFDTFDLSGRFAADSVTALWSRYVGSDNIRVRSLSAVDLEGGDLVVDLLTAVGVDPAVKNAATAESLAPSNTAIRWEVAEYLRAFHGRVAEAYQGWSAAERNEVAAARLAVPVETVYLPGKMRTCRTYRILRMIRPCVRAAERVAPAASVRYLTRAQHEKLVELYRQQTARLRDLVPDVRVTVAERPVPAEERPFQPTLETIPEAMRRALGAAGAELAVEEVSAPLAAIIEEMRRRTLA